jgi:hypothetical protein
MLIPLHEMPVAGLLALVFAGLVIFALVSNADSLPKSFLRFLGCFLLAGCMLELFLLAWVVTYVVSGDAPWDLSR